MDPRARRWVMVIVVILMIGAGSPALWAGAQDQPRPTPFTPAWTTYEQQGTVGNQTILDSHSSPGVRCNNDLTTFPGFVDIKTRLPQVYASTGYATATQTVGVRADLFQLRPGGTGYDLVALSDLMLGTATPSLPVSFQDYTFAGQPLGPIYVVAVEMYWYQADGITIDGVTHATLDFYQRVQIKNGTPNPLWVEQSCTSPVMPNVVAPMERGIVNSRYPFELSYFPINRAVNILFGGQNLGTVQTDARGEAHDRFRIPAAPMGDYDVRWFTGDWSARASVTVIPRIKVTPAQAAPGDDIGISLRGYAARETVRIRWQQGNTWTELARVTTSSTGSANTKITVPDWAPAGPASVRGDSTSPSGGRAQTNAFTVVRPVPGALTLSSTRGTVNSRVTASISNFPPNTPVTLTFPGFYPATATATTDSTGKATLTFRVPASPLGMYTVQVTSGGTEATSTYEIVPRIKLTPGQAARGNQIDVSLRGYAGRESVRIRWKHGSTYEELTTITTSGSGSANLTISVPSWAPDGPQSVRGDGTTGRAQTNAFAVSGGQFSDANALSPTPTAVPSESATPAAILPTTAPEITTPDIEPTGTISSTPTPSPTASPPDATPVPERT
jgi:hypothetical protein